MPAPVWPPRPKLHKRSGCSRVLWRGEEHWLGRHGSPEAAIAYGRLLERLRALEAGRTAGGGARPTIPADDAPAVAEVVARWLREEAPRYDPAGREPAQFARAFVPLLSLHAAAPAADLDALALDAVRLEMGRLGWCAATVNRQTVRLRTVWRWAEGRRLVPRGSWGGLRVLKPVAGNDRRYTHRPALAAVDQGQVELLLLFCHPCLGAMVYVQWLTGMRSGEVRVMRPGDVDRRGPVWVYRPHRHKNAWRGAGHEREVPLGPLAQAELAPWLAGKGPLEWVFPAVRGCKRTDLPWSLHRSGPRCYTATGYAQAFRRAAQAAPLPEGLHRPYCLRHGCKKRVADAHGIDAARAFLGQKSVEATAHYAAARDLSAAADLARLLG